MISTNLETNVVTDPVGVIHRLGNVAFFSEYRTSTMSAKKSSASIYLSRVRTYALHVGLCMHKNVHVRVHNQSRPQMCITVIHVMQAYSRFQGCKLLFSNCRGYSVYTFDSQIEF